MAQQFYYREFSSMKKKVESFLSRSSHIRVIYKESDRVNNIVVYNLKLRWSLINLLLFNHRIKVILNKVDDQITRMELQMSKGEQKWRSFFSTSTSRFL